MSTSFILLLVIGLVSTLSMVVLIYAIYNNSVKVPRDTQWQLSDKEILILISKQNNGYLTAEQLAEASELSKASAKKRLYNLLYKKVITSKTTGIKAYFKLNEEIDLRQGPQLSHNPFITTDDLFVLFKHHNYELTLHKICIDTGLPVNVIYKELKRFVKEKIIVKLYDSFGKTSYILKEPYDSNPDKPIESEDFLDLDLSKIYHKETSKKNR